MAIPNRPRDRRSQTSFLRTPTSYEAVMKVDAYVSALCNPVQGPEAHDYAVICVHTSRDDAGETPERRPLHKRRHDIGAELI
jgi:hypothetical protein